MAATLFAGQIPINLAIIRPSSAGRRTAPCFAALLAKCLYKLLKKWWTWSGSVLHGVLIIRKLLILRMPKRPKMPSLPDRLYDFYTANFSKPKLVLPTGTLSVSSFQSTYSNSPNISSSSKKRSNGFSNATSLRRNEHPGSLLLDFNLFACLQQSRDTKA